MRRKLLGLAGVVVGVVGVLAGQQLGAARAGQPAGLSGAASTGEPGTAGYHDGSVTGPVVETLFGPVQVQVTIRGGRIVDAQAIQTPYEHRRSVAINQYAAPRLRQEVLTAQSASIRIVSGATTTSEAYAQSLQAALDQAQS